MVVWWKAGQFITQTRDNIIYVLKRPGFCAYGLTLAHPICTQTLIDCSTSNPPDQDGGYTEHQVGQEGQEGQEGHLFHLFLESQPTLGRSEWLLLPSRLRQSVWRGLQTLQCETPWLSCVGTAAELSTRTSASVFVVWSHMLIIRLLHYTVPCARDLYISSACDYYCASLWWMTFLSIMACTTLVPVFYSDIWTPWRYKNAHCCTIILIYCAWLLIIIYNVVMYNKFYAHSKMASVSIYNSWVDAVTFYWNLPQFTQASAPQQVGSSVIEKPRW